MDVPNEKEEAIRMQGARKLRKDEEKVWAPPRNITKWPDWDEPREREESEWRLEPEGEAEVPEIIIVSDAVECTFVDLDGESRLELVEAKLSEEGEKYSTRVRRQKVQEESDSGGSEETQEYVQEAKSMEYEEEEERTFVPSAVSVPLNLDGKSLQEEQKESIEKVEEVKRS